MFPSGRSAPLIRAERSATGHQLLPLVGDLYQNALATTCVVPGLGAFLEPSLE